MKLRKTLAIGLSIGLALGTFGCSNKTETPNEENITNNSATETNKYAGTEYYNQYSDLYSNNLRPLSNYNIYRTVDDVNKAYENENDYPGNEKYLSDLKAAYKDSKEKIQAFIDGLKNDVKTDDKDLKAANDELIAEGEKLINEIDNKMKKLDTISEDDYSKSKDEFIKLVDDTTKVEGDVSNEFDKMIKNMNEMLGINTTPSTKTTK